MEDSSGQIVLGSDAAQGVFANVQRFPHIARASIRLDSELVERAAVVVTRNSDSQLLVSGLSDVLSRLPPHTLLHGFASEGTEMAIHFSSTSSRAEAGGPDAVAQGSKRKRRDQVGPGGCGRAPSPCLVLSWGQQRSS